MLRVHLFCVIIACRNVRVRGTLALCFAIRLNDVNTFCLSGLTTPFVVSRHVQFYRKDYTYVEEYDAFYKVHWDDSGISWSSAFTTCNDEGARLFYPSGDEWTVINNLTETMTVAPNTTEIYVGYHDEFHLGEFITIDGNPTDSPLNAEEDYSVHKRCIMMDYVTGQFRVSKCIVKPGDSAVPFVCKKQEEVSCPTIDNEYKYDKNTNKCFKVNNIPKTWQSAMQTCYMEGGILAIFEDKAAVDWLASSNQKYYVGFRRMFSSHDYYTVRGKKFVNERINDQYYDVTNADCGVIIYKQNEGIQIGRTECDQFLPFICEMAMK